MAIWKCNADVESRARSYQTLRIRSRVFLLLLVAIATCHVASHRKCTPRGQDDAGSVRLGQAGCAQLHGSASERACARR
eukprot:15472765-Alexandrium_andersonii.AAC.1